MTESMECLLCKEKLNHIRLFGVEKKALQEDKLVI